jgi:predicted glutamine amidotransferase
MCRLFAMSGGAEPVSAKLWLLEAPDSLAQQSHRNPDGTGLGIFDAEGRPVVHKAPISAFTDTAFASEARSERSRTFLAHVRFASTGAKTLANTHPFEQDGRLFAHNGVLAGLSQLEEELGDDRALVHGETDSERLFALITREIRRHDGDIHAGIVAGVSWIAENLPIYSLNLIITTEDEVFALRYPDNNKLYVLERGAGGVSGEEALNHHSSLGTRVHCVQAAQRPVVVLASEPMDEDPGWRAMQPGELLHVGPELEVSSAIVLGDPPAHLLDLSTLSERGRSSQSSGPGAG